MSMIKIKFSSITHALKAKEILSSSGYNVRINKNSNSSAKVGCGYNIILSGDVNKISLQLDLHKVKYIGFELMT